MTVLTLDEIDLPLDLVWVDEFDFTPIEQKQTRTLTGAIVFETAEKQGGRNITIGEGDAPVFVKKTIIDALYAKLTANSVMTLTLQDTRSFSVRFQHEDKPLEAKPVIDYQIMEDSHPYHLTLKLITTG